MTRLAGLARLCEAPFAPFADIHYRVDKLTGMPAISVVPHNATGATITIFESVVGYTVFAESLEVDSEATVSFSHDEFVLGVTSMIARYGVRQYSWYHLGVLSVCGAVENIGQVAGKRVRKREIGRWESWEGASNAILPFLAEVEALRPVLRIVRVGPSAILR